MAIRKLVEEFDDKCKFHKAMKTNQNLVDTLKNTNSRTTFQLVRMISNLSTSTKDKSRTS